MSPDPRATGNLPPAIELNKNGTISRKRLHQGNLPSIPRTEECQICAAKFTRLNHLKRHLLTHTDSRKHKCDKCHFQFTRRDLLTKHMRICGKPKVRSHKSRRKSCIPCATAKCKCDLQQPCACCKTRNKDCVFPTENPTDMCPVTPEQQWTLPDSPNATALQSASRTLIERPSLETFVSPLSPMQHSENAPLELTSFVPSDSSPRSSTSPFLLDSFLDAKAVFGSFRNSPAYPHSLPSVPVSTICLPLKTPLLTSGHIESLDDSTESQLRNYISVTSALDMERCCSLCVQRFTVNIPIIHAASWTTEDKPSILITVMQACGANFLDSAEARTFVRYVADTVPGMLCVELDRCPADLSAQSYLISAYLFLQSEAIFNLQPPGWNIEKTRAAVVRMINRNKFAYALAAWKHPSMSSSTAAVIREDWRTWSEYEAYKRLLWLLNVYDIISNVFFGAKCHINLSDLSVPIPGETNAWEARTSMEWFWIIAGDSKYTHFQDSFVGTSVFNVLSTLRQHTTPSLPYNSWQLAASISVINLEINRALVDRKAAKMESFQYYDHSRGAPTKIAFLGEHLEFGEMRLMLYNWFEAWKRCPGVFDRDGNPKLQDACFYELLYLYYTAHVLFCAYVKPLDEFTWDGPGTARAAKISLQRRILKGDKSTIVSWEILSNTLFSNANDDASTPFSTADDHLSFRSGLAIYG